MHRRRIAQADGPAWRYLTVQQQGEAVAFGCLLLAQPSQWPEISPLPKVVDLCVRSDLRGRGVGTWFMGRMEELASAAGFDRLWLSVDPEANPRALTFYKRLGYKPTTRQWQWVSWSFTDAGGNQRSAEGWDLTLSKSLGPGDRSDHPARGHA